jgi:hypothetical protein
MFLLFGRLRLPLGGGPPGEIESVNLRVVSAIHGKAGMEAHILKSADPPRLVTKLRILRALHEQHRQGLALGAYAHEGHPLLALW